MKLKRITLKKALKRIKKGKPTYGLSESFWLDDEWDKLSKKYIDEVSTYYRVFAKPIK